jgi:hypothetical protein
VPLPSGSPLGVSWTVNVCGVRTGTVVGAPSSPMAADAGPASTVNASSANNETIVASCLRGNPPVDACGTRCIYLFHPLCHETNPGARGSRRHADGRCPNTRVRPALPGRSRRLLARVDRGDVAYGGMVRGLLCCWLTPLDPNAIYAALEKRHIAFDHDVASANGKLRRETSAR